MFSYPKGFSSDRPDSSWLIILGVRKMINSCFFFDGFIGRTKEPAQEGNILKQGNSRMTFTFDKRIDPPDHHGGAIINKDISPKYYWWKRSGGALPLLDSFCSGKRKPFSIAISIIIDPSLVTWGVTFKDRGAETVSKARVIVPEGSVISLA